MDKKTRLTIIIGSLVTFIVVPSVTILVLTLTHPKAQDNTQTTQDIADLPSRSGDELMAAITSQQPSLVSDGSPIFAIVDTDKSQKGWYIITIRQLDDPDGENPAKVLLQDTGGKNGLKLLLGPGTQFPTDVTKPLGIPSPVVEELNK